MEGQIVVGARIDGDEPQAGELLTHRGDEIHARRPPRRQGTPTVELLRHLGAHLEAARPDARADHRRMRLGPQPGHRRDRRLDDTGDDAAPSGVGHPDAGGSDHGDRQAVGNGHRHRKSRLGGDHGIGLPHHAGSRCDHHSGTVDLTRPGPVCPDAESRSHRPGRLPITTRIAIRRGAECDARSLLRADHCWRKSGISTSNGSSGDCEPTGSRTCRSG